MLAGQLRRDLHEAVILEARAGQDLAACLHLIAGGSARIIGVAGGDGTISAGASAAQEMGFPLLVIPAGTFHMLRITALLPGEHETGASDVVLVLPGKRFDYPGSGVVPAAAQRAQ
jgi:predicted polyphosphate/ATP-dependent NAD kinase